MRNRVAAVILAAGASRRMAGASKLLLDLEGMPLVRRAVLPFLRPGVDEVILVHAEGAEPVVAAVAGLPVRCVVNRGAERGMSTSLCCGVGALDDRCRWVLVGLGDMPRIAPATVDRLIAALGETPHGILLPTHRTRRGHPVALDLAKYRWEVLSLRGDQGARALLLAHPEDIERVPVDDPGVLLDVDTPSEYEALLRPAGTGKAATRDG